MTHVELARMGGRASARARRTARRMRVLEWAPVVTPPKPIPVNPGNDKKENNMNCARIIREAIARKAITGSLALFLCVVSCQGAGALIEATFPAGCQSIRIMIGLTKTNFFITNTFRVLATDTISTNLLTNLVSSTTNYIAGQLVSTNGTLSDVSTNIWTITPSPIDGIRIIPMSFVAPLGTEIQVSRDLRTWRERFKVTDAAPVIVSARIGAAAVSTPAPPMILVSYSLAPEQPQLFFRVAPGPVMVSKPPIP